ncbi:MAG: M42 family metallopeptidase [Candidatus Mcinerneyibacterium aminivorans]|uniref:M42 family metallopeptidase n=1 Tax=Candidatus Mcinerneyibacterium aminivorans TaxID=2703815 RepID=A0A5D0MF78_9BACT|nr:MAG: M42 family metallopeptidase [Candidatus Mcinerneyibacterium aminivorans]
MENFKLNSIEKKEIINYLENIINIPSPTGFTSEITKFLIKNAEKNNIKYTQTKKGAIIYEFESEKATGENTLFACHIDTLGAMVNKVEENKIKITSIGGYPAFYIIGNYCRIHSFNNKTYKGTILPDNPSVHVNKDLSKKKFKLNDLYIRPDIITDENKTLDNYIEVGNFVSFDPGFKTVNDFIKSRHLDDKSSASIFLHLANLINNNKNLLNQNIYFYFNITEETGQGIAGMPDIDNLIIVDMGVVGDSVEGDERSVSICAKDSSGPYNYNLVHKMVQLSKENKIDYKVDVFPYYGSDGSAALRAGKDIKVGLIGPGVSASHGYERTHTKGLINTAKLIISFINDKN